MDALKAKIKSKKIIFFDVFDTLIQRAVLKPEDIFALIEQKIYKDYNIKVNFAELRKSAEDSARHKFPYTEVTLDEIYSEFASQRLSRSMLSGLECQAELDFSLPVSKGIDYYKFARSLNKKIYIVTDMYLPHEVISNILNKWGINGYCKIYVSGEYHLTKSSGKLFQYILNEEKLDPKDIIHIGDNKLADYKMPIANGIDAYLCSFKPNKQIKYNSKYIDKGLTNELECNSISIFQHRYRNVFPNQAYKTGYLYFGPLVLGFILWLKRNLDNDHIDHVLFCARDGYLLKKCYDAIFPPNIFNISTTYFYISRKAMVIPCLQFDSTIEEMISRYKSLPAHYDVDFIKRKLGISDYLYTGNIESLTLDDLNNIIPDIKKYSSAQGYLFNQYLLSMNLSHKNIAIVDIGGNRTIEKNFRFYLSNNNFAASKLESFSLEMTDQESDDSRAFLYAKGKNNKIEEFIQPFYYFLEVLLTAPHGTVKGYRLENNDVVPVLGKYDYVNDHIDEVKLLQLQSGVLQFCKDYYSLGIQYMYLNPFTCVENLCGFGMYPTNTDLEYWGSFKFNADSFTSMIKYSGFISYLLNPIKYYKDYKASLWKSGFISRLIGTSSFNGFLYKLKHELK